ncbi:DUF3135 domain-containing protein [Ningiella sp. W23]|uniref:DUF3135 domain-containing protein n=1 Tax=Ningiella sp. W23 TaxID=3023715 RepID=UPI0037574D5E
MSTELDFDFDRMKELHNSSPEEFEEMRKQLIEQALQKASKKSQKRLRGLQFQIDAKREANKHKPFVSCLEVTKMMHDSFNKMRVHLNHLAGKNANIITQVPDNSEDKRAIGEVSSNASSAKILKFKR